MRNLVMALILLFPLAVVVPHPAQAQSAPGVVAFAGPYGLWTIGADGRGEQLLNSGANADMPSFAPDGKKLVYVIVGTPDQGAWIYDFTTGTRQLLSREPWRWPSWSPDGKKIAYTLPRPGGSDVLVYDFLLQSTFALTNDGLNEAPTWWRDSTKILFSHNGELWVTGLNAADSGPVPGTVGTTILQAAYAPDGLRMAYLTVAKDRDFLDPAAPTQIWVATSEGRDGQWVTQGNIDRTQRISWSTDGSRLAFSTYTGGGTDVYVMYANGGDWMRLSDGRNPVWRPEVADVNRPISTVCQPKPDRIFGQAFTLRPSIQQRIGCPTGDIVSVDGAMQEFDGGFMYWRNVTGGTSVWVFFNDGTWVTGDPNLPARVPVMQPPPGKGVPRNAFLAVWLALGGPASRLGWALGPEANFPSDGQPYERGLAFGGNNQVVFVNIDGTYDVVPVQ